MEMFTQPGMATPPPPGLYGHGVIRGGPCGDCLQLLYEAGGAVYP